MIIIVHLNYRHLAAKHKHNTHLQNDSKSVPDIIGVELLKALSTITTLQQKRISHSSLAKFFFQSTSLTSEHNGRERFECFQNRLKHSRIRVFRELRSLFRLPAIDIPLFQARYCGSRSNGRFR